MAAEATTDDGIAITSKGISDPYYRYKMPRPIVVVTGKMYKRMSVIENRHAIAKALGVTEAILFLAIKTRLHTHGKKGKGYSGEFTSEQMIEAIRDFADDFLICSCSGCGDPEVSLDINYTKKPKRSKAYKLITKTCKACGKRERAPDAGSFSLALYHGLSAHRLTNKEREAKEEEKP